MRLKIAHETTYRFDPPMHGVVQSHRLTPSVYEGQSTINWSVNVEGAERGAGFRDGAGDWVDTITVMGPVSELLVQVAGEVETVDLGGVLRGHREKMVPTAYLRATHATKADRQITEFAADSVEGIPASDALSRAHALCKAVAGAIAYTPGQTGSGTRAAEALALGHGVCQDHAHTIIASALTLDMPARYVTGYLFSSEAVGMHEASHAWAEVFVPDLGWVGLDASNGVSPDERYVRIGSGADAEEAAPIRGMAQGTGIESLDAHVRVDQVAQ